MSHKEHTMRSLQHIFVAALALLFAANVARGQALPIYESFNYPAGALVAGSSSVWTNHSGTAGTLGVIDTAGDSGNSLSFTGLAAPAGNRALVSQAQSEDAGRNFDAVTSGAVYASALVKVTTVPGDDTAEHYIMHFFQSNTGTSFYGRLSVATRGAGFSFGIRNSSSGTGPVTYEATERALNTTFLIVIKYDIVAGADNDVYSLYVNPVPGAAEPAATLTQTIVTGQTEVSVAGIARVGLRQAALNGIVELDELRVGTTWASVTPTSGPVADNPDILVGTTLNLADTEVNQTSTTNLVVTNAVGSTNPLNITGLTYVSGDAGVFTVLTSPLPTGIAGGASANISIQFAPGATPGAKSAIFSLASNDPSNGTIQITFNGTGFTYTPVADIAAVRALSTGTYFSLTSTPQLGVNADSFNAASGNRLYPVQDASGGIILQENESALVIAADACRGTVLTGVKGRKAAPFSGQEQATLIDVTSTSAGTLNPEVVTAAAYLAAPVDTYESELLSFAGLTRSGTPADPAVWAVNTNYTFDAITVRIAGSGMRTDLIGTTLPTIGVSTPLLAIGSRFNTTLQLNPIVNADISCSPTSSVEGWQLFE